VDWKSFAQVHTTASEYGSRLVERGVRPGDVCIVVMPTGETAALSILAILLVGGVPVLVAPPVLPGLHSNLTQILERVARKTRAKVMLADASTLDCATDAAENVRRLQVLVHPADFSDGDAGSAPLHLPSTTDVAAMQLTSGTTGFPRVCVWTHDQVLRALDGMGEAMGLREDDVCMNWTPYYHDMGLVNNLFLCLVRGIPLVQMKTLDFVRDPGIWLRGLAAAGATVTWSPNFGFALAARKVTLEDLEGVRLDHVRAFWNAAEQIHRHTMERFLEVFGPIGVRRDALRTNFGLAENVGGATFSRRGGLVVEYLDREALQRGRKAVPVPPEAREGSVPIVGVGRPYPGMSIEILSRNGAKLEEGRVGEITLRTPSRMSGYLQDAQATRRALRGDLLRTGDLGYTRDGELFWVGRLRDQINLRGIKLDASDFEEVLLQIDGLRPGCFAAFGAPDRELGTQRLVIVAEVRNNSPHSPDQMVDIIRERVAHRLGVTVDEVVLVEQGTMTKTSSGKRRHRFYRKLYVEGGLEDVTLKGPELVAPSG